ncbi:TPA: sigma-70 family RNA polymerase sigma factor [Candidatus Galligastranaerophilus intestinigallinarum]|nr:sigma-70 family RNA polymerase sigma factor [Candidatus Galligastranaerophilus intestinigallinarum]
MKQTEDEFSQLAKLAKNGDKESLKKLLLKTEKLIYISLYYLAENNCELSDVIQESLLKISKNLKKLNDTKAYKSWANKIAIRCFYDYKRKNKKSENCSQISQNDKILTNIICEKQKEPIENCINSELVKVIKSSISKLNEPYKLAIIMREFEGLSYDEIAKLTKTNVGTVKSRIARARCQLKEYIKPYME